MIPVYNCQKGRPGALGEPSAGCRSTRPRLPLPLPTPYRLAPGKRSV